MEHRTRPFLTITPSPALMYEPIIVRIGGLAPGAMVSVGTCLTDTVGVCWRAEGRFVADAFGAVATDRAPSAGGTYLGVDHGGLFWSMRPDTGEARETFIKAGRHRMHAYGQPGFEREADTRVTVSCRDTDGALVAETEFTLCFRAPEVEIRPLRHGRLRGLIWGPADDSPGQGVVFTLGGSGGGVDISTAPLLASLGYRVISLAYFAYEDLPKQLHDIPLEYFTEGFAWARQTYDVERVAILGASRGGELVLLLGATYPDAICGVVAQIPMHVIMGGYSDEGKPAASWTLNERRLPFVPIDDDALETPEDPEEEVAWTAVSDRFLKDPALTRGAEIEVEGIRCPLLLVSGEDDAMWDSPWGADRVLDRLRAKGSPIPVQHLKLRDTGHLLGMPNRVMSLLGPIVHPQLPIKLSVGGRAAGTAREAWRHWATLTGFLETCFSGFLPRDFARRRRVGVAE